MMEVQLLNAHSFHVDADTFHIDRTGSILDLKKGGKTVAIVSVSKLLSVRQIETA